MVTSEGAEPQNMNRGIRKTRRSDDDENLVLLDSGATVALQRYPEHWKGVPPANATPTTVELGAGEVQGMQLGDTVYLSDKYPDCDPVIPWGRWSTKW